MRLCEEKEGWQRLYRTLGTTNLLETQKLELYTKPLLLGPLWLEFLMLHSILPP